MAHAVADKTARAYNKEVSLFIDCAKLNQIPANSAEQLDKALATYMDFQCYAEQKGGQHGGKASRGRQRPLPGANRQAAFGLAVTHRLAEDVGGGQGHAVCRTSCWPSSRAT